jgi:hypothetical protein
MKKVLDPKSPEYRDLVKKLTTSKTSVPSPLFKTSLSNLPVKTKKIPKKRTVVVKKKARMLTGDKNVDLLIMENLGDRDLFNFCISDKYAASLCKNEDFWRNRFMSRFGKTAGKYKPEKRTWKNHYLKVVSVLDQYSKNRWDFFDLLSWNFKDEIEYIEKVGEGFISVNIEQAPEDIQILYWLLDLGKNIKLRFPIDRYGELEDIEREYKSEIYFTPYEVMKIIRKFYDEPLTRKELGEQKDVGNPYAEDYTLEDADKGEVKRYDMLSFFFEGFCKDEDGVYGILYGT